MIDSDEAHKRLHTEIKCLRAVVECVRRERAAREAWLASLPEGSCGNPPPNELLDAEGATELALRRLDAPIVGCDVCGVMLPANILSVSMPEAHAAPCGAPCLGGGVAPAMVARSHGANGQCPSCGEVTP